MKHAFLLFVLFTLPLSAQNSLKFDKRNVECENKWVAFPMAKDSTYSFGFIYIDYQAGLTLEFEGSFKIAANGTFTKSNNPKEQKVGFNKVRLKPNRTAIAEIPETKFKELGIIKEPEWLYIYKGDENSVSQMYRWGFLYNSWNEVAKGLTYLEKANKIDPDFKGLQTELAFSYNALGNFDKAEKALIKAIKKDPKDCYTYKELAFTQTKLAQLDNVAATFQKMTTICDGDTTYLQETAYNLAYEYFKVKNKAKFDNWKAVTKKLAKSENQYTNNLDLMEADWNK
jgi:tetratricopeptide (TPR) repeat protein